MHHCPIARLQVRFATAHQVLNARVASDQLSCCRFCHDKFRDSGNVPPAVCTALMRVMHFLLTQNPTSIINLLTGATTTVGSSAGPFIRRPSGTCGVNDFAVDATGSFSDSSTTYWGMRGNEARCGAQSFDVPTTANGFVAAASQTSPAWFVWVRPGAFVAVSGRSPQKNLFFEKSLYM